ncbi:hypothetical protein N0V82_006415 [Gnomoniopsis sp. IMI 355080]|nr:hypothetical protein N0V82_006415 [Gnomoniopsis sp. IMI 355080]
MRYSIPLALAALTCQVTARLPWTLDIRGADPSKPTQIQSPVLRDTDVDNALSALPAPTTTPPPSQAAIELRLRQDSSTASSNTWENSQTCGWYSGLSSKAYVCESPLTCATNTDNVVACSTAGLTEFYTICLNYEAVQSSKCTSAGPKTACCTDSAAPACGTFQWTGTPTRSMYRCFATPTIIAMIDEPQAVLDASISSASAASSSSAVAAASRSSASAASASSASAAAASAASGLGGSSVTITTTATDGSSTTFTAVAGATGSASGVTFLTSVQYTTTGSDGASTTYTAIGQAGVVGANGSNGSNGSNGGSGGVSTGTIAGSVIGGILGLLMMLLLMWYLMKKKSGNKLSFKFCGGKKKVEKGDKHTNKFSFTEKNKDNREYNDKREYDNRRSSGSNDGKGKGFSLFGGGAKSKSKKEENTTNNYYYGDEVRNDNRSYDKRKYKDNRKYHSDSESPSVTPSQTQGFHYDNEGQGSGQRPSFDSRDTTVVGIGAIGGRGSSRRDQRQRGPSSRTQNYEPDSRSPSPARVSPLPSAAAVGAGGGTSRRDKRRQQRKEARGDYTPSPDPHADRHDVEYVEDEEEEAAPRASGTPTDWHSLAPHVAPYLNEGNGSQQPQNVHVHVHIHDREREGRRGRSRRSQSRSRASSNRARHYDDEEDELDEEERRQEVEREQQGSRTHRYHPGSGRRNVPISRSPSPPPATLAPHPDDFIGRGL